MSYSLIDVNLQAIQIAGEWVRNIPGHHLDTIDLLDSLLHAKAVVPEWYVRFWHWPRQRRSYSLDFVGCALSAHAISPSPPTKRISITSVLNRLVGWK